MMKNFNEGTPTANVKKKNSMVLLEYCIENRIEFSVSPRISGNEEYEISFNPANTQQAISLGMCLRELRVELNGHKTVPVSAVKATKKAVKQNGSSKVEPVVSESSTDFNNDEELELNLEASN